MINKKMLNKLYAQKNTKHLLNEAEWMLKFYPWLHDMYIDPIIITPILYKEKYFMRPMYKLILDQLWAKAYVALTTSKELVIIGYSFPSTDFHVRKMFLEAFSHHSLDNLIVVNPNSQVRQKASELCHFNDPMAFDNLQGYTEYMDSHSKLCTENR
jgi:hypothetical protein